MGFCRAPGLRISAHPGLTQRPAGPTPEKQGTGDGAHRLAARSLRHEAQAREAFRPGGRISGGISGSLSTRDSRAVDPGRDPEAPFRTPAAAPRGACPECKEPRLLLARCLARRAPGAHVNLIPALIAHHVGLGRALRERDHGHPATGVRLHRLEERQDRRMHLTPEDRIHHPLLEMLTPDAGDGPVVFHTEEDHAA